MRALALALVLALPALAACSGGEDSSASASVSEQDTDKQWQDAAEKALGAEVDVEVLRQQAAVDCQRTDVANWIVTLGTAGDTATAEVTRVGLQQLCPPVEDAFAQALKEIEDAPDVNALVCAQPVAKLDTEERMKLDFIC